MSKKIMIIYAIIMNVVMSFTMSISGSLMHGGINKMTWILLGISFCIGMIITLTIPLNRIGDWFTGLFKMKKETIWSLIVANLLNNFIVTIILSFCMTNASLKFTYPDVLFAWLSDFPIMYLIAYVASLIVNIIWFIIAMPKLMKKKENPNV